MHRFQGQQGATVAERVLRITWLILPIGAVVSAVVCLLVLWRSTATGGDLEYQQAVIAHGTWSLNAPASCTLACWACCPSAIVIIDTQLCTTRLERPQNIVLVPDCGLLLSI